MVRKLSISESLHTNMSIEDFMNILSDTFYKYFPDANLDIQYVKNMRHDNIWITALGYGNFNIDTSVNFDMDDVINFQVTIDLGKKYESVSDFIDTMYEITIVPSGVIYLPKYVGYSYDKVVGSGRTTGGDIDKILSKFDKFCSNCKSMYRKYYK